MAQGSDGIVFKKDDWSAILAQAKAEDKLIFVDAYTTWCGPCKKMDRDVFPQMEVGSFYNAMFINVVGIGVFLLPSCKTAFVIRKMFLSEICC